MQAAYAGRVYPGVRAIGVSVGGQTRDESRAALERGVAAIAARQLDIGHEELRWTVTGWHVGVRPNVEPLLDQAFAVGREGSIPSRLASQLGLLVQGSDVIGSLIDRVELDAFMEALAGAVERPVVDARVDIRPSGAVEMTDAQVGRKLSIDDTRRRLEDALARPDAQYVSLAVETVTPRVSSADLADARAEAERLLSAPIVLRFEDGERVMSVQEIAPLIEVGADHRAGLNREAVRGWVNALAKEIDQRPQNARFTWAGGKLSLLRPSKNGRDLDLERTAELLTARAFDEDRTVLLPVNLTRPDVSQDDADKLNIKGAVEVAATSFAGASPPKQYNINLAAQRLNGVVVPPGKMFSFNQEVGPTTLDAGFKLGWGIASSATGLRTVPAEAGGICQVATTLFHSVFFAGYQVEERNYHAYWISSYSAKGIEGLDATVDELVPLDFKFWNNTENYLLVQSWTEGSRVVFGLYGTKPDWTVKVTPGQRKDVVEASRDPVTEEEPSLPAGQRLGVEGAMDGFKITNTRTVTRGSDVRTLQLTSLYRPSRNVTLVGTGGRPAAPPQATNTRVSRPAEATPATRAASPAPAPTIGGAASRPASAPTPAPAAKPTAQPSREGPAPAAKPTAPPARSS